MQQHYLDQSQFREKFWRVEETCYHSNPNDPPQLILMRKSRMTKMWQPRKHNEKAEWIKNMTKELERVEEGPKAEIDIDFLKTTLKKSILKTPGHDGIHGFWFKKFISIHDRQSLEMNRCLQGVNIPKWMTKGKTTLTRKDLIKGTAPNNYRLITCLPMMWKILTAQIGEEIYYSQTSRGLFPKEQKVFCKSSYSLD